ncbi:MAG: single-stranded DNA-binding protein [Planctomycetes bacterium]|nr:single-stranded DNA-binding protein [Planctomycetota bacterium]
MANFNKVLLAGNLTRDPQLSHLPSNMAVVEFGMAINSKWRSHTGEMKEDTCFVELRAYGKQAETLNQYMTKGKALLVEGKLRYRSWDGKDGQKRSKLFVVVDTFQFLGGPPGSGAGNNRGGESYERTERPAVPARSSGGGSAAPMDEMPPIDETVPAGDDIPF